MKRKNIILVVAILLLLIISLFIKKADAQAPDLTPYEKYDAAMDIWLNKVVELESQGTCDVVNPKDSDGLPAFGSFQYKLSTVISLSKKYNVYSNVTPDTAYTIAMSCEKSRHLTKTVMQKNPQEFSQWGGRTKRGAGFPPKLADFLPKE